MTLPPDNQTAASMSRDAARGPSAGARGITDLAVAYWRSCVLFAANKLDLFTAIGAGAETAADLAQARQLDLRATEKLLDACATCGLLDKTDRTYSLVDDARRYLDRASPTYLGDWIAHWADMLAKGNWQMLAEHVRRGEPPRQPRAVVDNFDEQNDPLRNWVVGMHQVAEAGHAAALVEAAPLGDATSLLDVGGGPGTYSVFLCRRYPQLKATILDAPDVAGVAQQLVREAGMTERIRFVSGDFRTHSLDRKFDAILLSNVLHMLDQPGAVTMLRNAARHLAADGKLIVQEWLIDDDGTKPLLSVLFNLHVFLDPNADLFRECQLIDMVERAGFVYCHTKRLEGLYDVILATREG